MSETIAAVATANGVGSIAIVRVSGDKALAAAQRLTSRTRFEPRHAYLLPLRDNDRSLIDEAIVIYFKAPYSFTGEDIVEFQCHGGFVTARRIMQTLTTIEGIRTAFPGEFSKRAFLNGKIDLSEAEAIAKLIEAKSEDAAKILAKQLKGDLKRFVEESREKLIEILAYSEVFIDYAEEDIPEETYDTLLRKIEKVEGELRGLVESSRRRRGLIEGFRVAIVGKPNVGKSSLLNALLSYERAIVSDIAGTTRDTIEEEVRIGSHLIRMIDTAGIRAANDTIERIGVERSKRSMEEADIVIALFDGSRPFDEEDKEIVAMIERFDKPCVVVVNKCDLPQRLDRKLLEKFDPVEVSVKGAFQRLIERMESLLDDLGGNDELLLVSQRQNKAVEDAADAVAEAKEPLRRGELEFFSYHIKEAIKAISSISRPFDNEEMLDKMFSEFCLGK